MLKRFLMIWLDNDEEKVNEIIQYNEWVEMTASRLDEVLENLITQLQDGNEK